MDNFLKNSGLKVTTPRLRILESLANTSKKHLSAEDLYILLKSKREDIGLATIYRVLTQFEAAGIVVKHNFSEGERKVAVFELVGGDHYHFVCTKCHKVIEFVDQTIENRLKEISKQYNFYVVRYPSCIHGRCKDCN